MLGVPSISQRAERDSEPILMYHTLPKRECVVAKLSVSSETPPSTIALL
jgi:hypothetical protein